MLQKNVTFFSRKKAFCKLCEYICNADKTEQFWK